MRHLEQDTSLMLHKQAGSLKQTQFQLREKYGVSVDWAQYCISCVCKSLQMTNDPDSSIIRLKRKAATGDTASLYEISKVNRSGKSVERDKEKHLAWLNELQIAIIGLHYAR